MKTLLKMTQRYGIELSLFSLSLLVSLLVGPLIIDDAYIYFRYVNNFCQGLGLVFNPGQPVLGVSSYLYTFILTIPSLPGLVDVALVAYWEGIVFHAISVVLIYRIGCQVKVPAVGLIAGLFYALLPRGVLAAVSGMETPLLIFLLLFCCLQLLEHHFLTAAILAGLISMTRLEGVLFGIPVLLSIFIYQKKINWGAIIVFITPLILCLALTQIVYKSWIPQTVIAKSVIYPVNQSAFENLIQVFYFLTYPFPIPDSLSTDLIQRFLIILVVGWGGVIWIRKVTLFLAFLAGISLIVAVYIIVNRYLFPWYLTILHPLYTLLIVMGAVDFSRRLVFRLSQIEKFILPLRWMRITGIIVLLTVSLLELTGDSIARAKELDSREQRYAAVGDWLNSLPPGQFEVAAVDIGAIGYNYQGKLYDLVGLTNPEVVTYYMDSGYEFRLPHLIPPRLIMEKQPQILVVYDEFLGNLQREPTFHQIYREIWRDESPHTYYGTMMVLVDRSAFEGNITQSFLDQAP